MFYRTLRPGESTVTFWDVVGDWFEDFFAGFWGSSESEKKRNSGSPTQATSSTNSNENFWSNLWHKSNIRIYKRSLRNLIRQKRNLQKVIDVINTTTNNNYQKNYYYQKIITKRDIVLPSFGTAGDIVNDMANTLINTATVWKYQ